MNTRWTAVGAVAVVAVLGMSTVTAQPPAPASFCERYPDAPACSAGDASCTVCHTSVPALNVYGEDVAAHLQPSAERPLHVDLFTAGLPEALEAVEPLDSDLDAYTNAEEIAFGSDPADPDSVPVKTRCKDGDKKDAYDLCAYDHDYAFKKVMIDVCGRSPTFEEREEFDKRSNKTKALHDTLDTCLDTEHWRGMYGVVWNLANDKIGPMASIKSGRNAGPIPLGDYDDDYAFWVYHQTDDRDARDVLTGQRFVSAEIEGGVTVLDEWSRTPLEEFGVRGFEVAQLVLYERRAGLLTHRWNLTVNTMFTGVPRTTAAQAYRAYLGYDISRLEGLAPVEGEPIDYDDKGVQREECAICHSTLDPLTYPFSRYEGIGGGNSDYIPFSYSANRMESFTWVDGPLVADTPEAGVLFGQPVADLMEWAEVAANSDAFRRKTVLDYWTLLVGERPRVGDQEAFAQLVEDFGDRHDYRVEAMLHDLIDTEAYGAP